jgi:hypothetical protein
MMAGSSDHLASMNMSITATPQQAAGQAAGWQHAQNTSGFALTEYKNTYQQIQQQRESSSCCADAARAGSRAREAGPKL